MAPTRFFFACSADLQVCRGGRPEGLRYTQLNAGAGLKACATHEIESRFRRNDKRA